MGRSNPAGEAPGSEHASRSESEPDSASLHVWGWSSLPDGTKPAIGGEATDASTRRTLRGDWGQRAWTDRPRNLGGPARWAVYDADLKGYFDSIPHDKLMACLRMRIADRTVLKLIRMWLEAPVVEPPDKPGGKPTMSRSKRGAPQGGVISPLLSNLYLHWFDKVFHGPQGPARWAGAKLVRYCDDFVVMAPRISPKLQGFIETKLEAWLGLEINRKKTRVLDLRQEGRSLDFLGFTFRYEQDRYGRGGRYLNCGPSEKALGRVRGRLRELTGSRRCFRPAPALVGELNHYLTGWAAYFRFGYPRKAFREINSYTRRRLTLHLRRRSQRPFRPPEGVSYYEQYKRWGLVYL